MFTKTLLLLALAAFACQAAPSSDDVIVDRIYNNVVVFNIDAAVAETKRLANHGDIIARVVKNLLRNNQHNIMEYGYKLWSDSKEIVKTHFPIQFRMLFDRNSVRIINKRDNLALKLGVATDSDGDRIAYGAGGDKTSIRVSWQFIPFLEHGRLYFKILNVQRSQYLKLGVGADSDGEYKGYSETKSETYRHQWYLRPVTCEGDLLFFIFNREYNQALKLDRSTDSIGDRLVWGHNGQVLERPDIYGWFILPF